MRTTITIPDEFHESLKKGLGSKGYLTVNDLILDLIRRHCETKPIIIQSTPRISEGYISDTTANRFKHIGPNVDYEEKPEEPERQQGRCQVPNGACRGFGGQYKVGSITSEGIQSKELYLCAVHLKQAGSECESVKDM